MQNYIVYTKNSAFDGKLAGVKFTEGKAVVSELTISRNLGHSVTQVLSMLRELGHEIFRFNEQDQTEIPWEPEKKEDEKPTKKKAKK